jgi:hypothetical protein
MKRGSRFLAGILSGCLVLGSLPVSAAEIPSETVEEIPSIPTENIGIGGVTLLTMKM